MGVVENMYITICKTDDQCKFDTEGRTLKTGALGQPRGMGWGGKWEGVQDGGTYVHPWLCMAKFMSMYGKKHHNIVLNVKVAQSCLTLCDPMDYTVYGILQTRILEWVAFPFSRGSSQPRDPTQVSRIAGGFFIS